MSEETQAHTYKQPFTEQHAEVHCPLRARVLPPLCLAALLSAYCPVGCRNRSLDSMERPWLAMTSYPSRDAYIVWKMFHLRISICPPGETYCKPATLCASRGRLSSEACVPLLPSDASPGWALLLRELLGNGSMGPIPLASKGLRPERNAGCWLLQEAGCPAGLVMEGRRVCPRTTSQLPSHLGSPSGSHALSLCAGDSKMHIQNSNERAPDTRSQRLCDRPLLWTGGVCPLNSSAEILPPCDSIR